MSRSSVNCRGRAKLRESIPLILRSEKKDGARNGTRAVDEDDEDDEG
jgi:hypothetical protein